MSDTATDELIAFANSMERRVCDGGGVVWRCRYSARAREAADRLCDALNSACVWMSLPRNWYCTGRSDDELILRHFDDT